MATLTVEVLCPTCQQPVTRHVPVRDGDDGVARPLPLLASGVCETCWPWDPEIEAVVKRRTVWAVEQDAKAKAQEEAA